MRTRNNLFRTFREFVAVNGNRAVTLCAIREENVKGGTNISIGYSVKRTDDLTQIKVKPGELPLNRKIALGRAKDAPFATLTVTLAPEDAHVYVSAMLDSFQQSFTERIEDYVVSVAGIKRKSLEKDLNGNATSFTIQDMEDNIEKLPIEERPTAAEQMVIQGLNMLNESVNKILNRNKNARTNLVEH